MNEIKTFDERNSVLFFSDPRNTTISDMKTTRQAPTRIAYLRKVKKPEIIFDDEPPKVLEAVIFIYPP